MSKARLFDREEPDEFRSVSPDQLKAMYVQAKEKHGECCDRVEYNQERLKKAKTRENDAVLYFLRIERSLKKRLIPFEALRLYRRGV